LEYFTIEQISKKYGIPTYQARRRLIGKGKAVDVKVVDKNRKLYAKELVLLVFGKASSEPPAEPSEPPPPSHQQPPTNASGKGKIFTPESVKRYANKVFYLKKMVANLERENDHLRTQNQNLTTLLAMEKQATLQTPKNDIKNDLKTNETKETAQSIGLLFLFVCSAILMLFFAFYLVS
jgi:regulator of replication initiation timing